MGRWSEQQLKTFQQFKANQKQEKPAPKKPKKKRDVAKPRATPLNKNSVIIGFDADVTKCGLSLYDVANHEVLDFTNLHFNDISEWLDKAKEQHGGRLYAKVERADNKSIFGAGKAAPGQRAKFNVHVKSGRSLELSNLFIDLLERKKILYEIIDASSRFNIENNKLPSSLFTNGVKTHYVDLTPEELLQRAKLMKSPKLSKLKATHIKAFFDMSKVGTGNSETRDALCLCMPEVIFFGLYRKK
jgi:hypothetical protein